MTSIARKMTNIGIAGETIEPGIVKTAQIARNGIFETKNTSWVGGYTKKVSDYVLNHSKMIPELEEGFYMKPLEKLPLKAFAATYKFYADVCELNGCEAQINFYINENNLETIEVDNEILVIKDIPGVDFWTETIFSYVPIQDNSGALTSTVDPIYYAFRDTMKAHIETHSHNTMGAFKSGTDEKNSNIEGLQLVFGKLKSKQYDFKSWVTISGEQFDDVPYQELLKYIDMPYTIGDIEELIEALDGFDTPATWLTQCKFTTYRAPKAYTRKSWDFSKGFSNGRVSDSSSKYPLVGDSYSYEFAEDDGDLTEESSFRKYSEDYFGDEIFPHEDFYEVPLEDEEEYEFEDEEVVDKAKEISELQKAHDESKNEPSKKEPFSPLLKIWEFMNNKN